MSYTESRVPWFLWPIHAVWRLVTFILNVPVLALLGELDLQVPPTQSAPEIQAAFERAGLADATVRVLPGLNHLFQEAITGSPTEYGRIEQTLSPTALDAVSEWILERFGR